MADDAATILDIVLACRRIARFVEAVEEPAFISHEEKRWAVVSQLMLIGEAVRRLSAGFRAEHTTIPWQQVAAMRNRLIHDYDQIDWAIVWHTVQLDAPRLLLELEPLLPELPAN